MGNVPLSTHGSRPIAETDVYQCLLFILQVFSKDACRRQLVFEDLKEWSLRSDNTVSYVVASDLMVTSRDWIGLYRVSRFYCAPACNATHGIAVAILSVSLSDACIVTKQNNRLSISQHHTKQGYLGSFLTNGVSCVLVYGFLTSFGFLTLKVTKRIVQRCWWA